MVSDASNLQHLVHGRAGLIGGRLGVTFARKMAPQLLEKIESGLGNGIGSDASNLQHLVHWRVADRGAAWGCRYRGARVSAKRFRPEMAPCNTLIRLNPGLEMVWARTPRTWSIRVDGRVADRGQLGPYARPAPARLS